MKFLLDTDHISILQMPSSREFGAVTARLAANLGLGVAVSIASFHEQVLGCQTYLGRARSTADLTRDYETLGRILSSFAKAVVVPFDSNAGLEYDQLRAARIRVGSMDLRVAAIALANGMIVVTRNHTDFGLIPGLLVEDWTK